MEYPVSDGLLQEILVEPTLTLNKPESFRVKLFSIKVKLAAALEVRSAEAIFRV